MGGSLVKLALLSILNSRLRFFFLLKMRSWENSPFQGLPEEEYIIFSVARFQSSILVTALLKSSTGPSAGTSEPPARCCRYNRDATSSVLAFAAMAVTDVNPLLCTRSTSSRLFLKLKVDTIEVLTALRKLPSGKSIRLDLASNELIKRCAGSALCFSLATWSKLLMSQSSFPVVWKSAITSAKLQRERMVPYPSLIDQLLFLACLSKVGVKRIHRSPDRTGSAENPFESSKICGSADQKKKSPALTCIHSPGPGARLDPGPAVERTTAIRHMRRTARCSATPHLHLCSVVAH